MSKRQTTTVTRIFHPGALVRVKEPFYPVFGELQQRNELLLVVCASVKQNRQTAYVEYGALATTGELVQDSFDVDVIEYYCEISVPCPKTKKTKTST